MGVLSELLGAALEEKRDGATHERLRADDGDDVEAKTRQERKKIEYKCLPSNLAKFLRLFCAKGGVGEVDGADKRREIVVEVR